MNHRLTILSTVAAVFAASAKPPGDTARQRDIQNHVYLRGLEAAIKTYANWYGTLPWNPANTNILNNASIVYSNLDARHLFLPNATTSLHRELRDEWDKPLLLTAKKLPDGITLVQIASSTFPVESGRDG